MTGLKPCATERTGQNKKGCRTKRQPFFASGMTNYALTICGINVP